MPITLLHTSDWHIAKPYGRYPADRAGILAHARLTAIDRLAAAARSGGAGVILVAGDTYDRPGLADKALREPMAKLATHDDLAWHIIPGNHDATGSGSVWERVARDGLPGNVTLHTEPRPVVLGEDCVLLPAPLSARAMSHDPTAWMDQVVTPAGMMRVGLAHGSVQGFGSERTASISIAPDRARIAGLAYLALGDWHGATEIDKRTWYSGTPEPDGYLDNAPGHALIVRLDGPGQPTSVERVPVGEYRWLERRIDASRATDVAHLEDEIRQLGSAAGRTLLSLIATGAVSVAEETALAGRLDRIDGAVFHLWRRLDELRLLASETDREALGDPILRSVAAELDHLANDPASPDAPAARRALRRLFALAAAAEGRP